MKDWVFTFDNHFTKRFYGTFLEFGLHDYSSTVHPCAYCSVFIDSVTEPRYREARLSEIRDASRSCVLCKLLIQVAERFQDDKNDDSIIVCQDGVSLRLGDKGPRILRLCSDMECPPPYRDDIPIGFPVLPESESFARFALLRSWLEWCDTTHDCNQPNPGLKGVSPTRLIYVGNADPEALHLHLPKKDEGVKYTALSHRWGNHPPSKDDPRFCTTDSNLGARLNRFSLSELPSTFQDAVRVTRELGIEYLWIDSLCIIQWNADDWKREASCMESVFTSAYCTIAATSAVDSNTGFLARSRSTEYMRVQDTTGNQVCICTHMDNFEKDVEQAELNKRAWVTQERVLAKRTIHFSANQTYWECGQGVYCENLTMMKSPLRRGYFLQDSSFPDRLIRSNDRLTVELIHFLFEDYSKRALTDPRDRCIAVSGLETRVAGALHCKSKHGIFEKYLHRNLLWYMLDKETARITYEDSQAVPSWSWMANSGGIRFVGIKYGSASWLDTITFDVERDSAALIADVGELQHVILKRDGNCYAVSTLTGEEKGWIRYDIEGGESVCRRYCVAIGQSESMTSKKHFYILVVVPTREDREYMRIGVGMVPASCVKRLKVGARVV